MQQVLIHFDKKADIDSLKSDIEKSDVDESEKVPSGLNSLKCKVDKLDVYKLVSFLLILKN